MRQVKKAPAAVMLLLYGIVVIIASCATTGSTALTSLSFSNQTTIAVDLVVNGTKVAALSPGVDGSIPASSLPAQPWTVQAQTASGRLLAVMTVRPGEVAQPSDQQRGDAVRIDLSCGRLDIWSGPPLIGPAPGSGQPGDCNP